MGKKIYQLRFRKSIYISIQICLQPYNVGPTSYDILVRIRESVGRPVVFLREVLIDAATLSSVLCSIPAENVNQPESITFTHNSKSSNWPAIKS